MVETLIIGAIAGLLIAGIVTYIALQVQRNSLKQAMSQIHAWERAQESHQQQWQAQQEHRAETLEERLIMLVEQLQHAWRDWVKRESDEQRQENRLLRAHIEHELATLRLVEDVPFVRNSKGQRRPQEAHWQPLNLQGVDLSGRDFSHMYLGHANLRGAILTHANLFMADLSNACLVGANLSHANLAAATLTGADLRGAILTGANVRVADLDDALVTGANLVDIQNLTYEQLASTIYDGSTQLGDDIDITLPRIPKTALPLVRQLPADHTIVPKPTNGNRPVSSSTNHDYRELDT